MNWTDPANWGGQLPGPSDDVVINAPGTPTIQLASDTQTIHSLNSADPLQITGGTLAVATTAQFSGTLNLAGGTLLGGTYSSSGPGSLTVSASSTIDGISFGSDVSVQGVTLHVRHGVTVNASLTLLGAASVLFDGTGSCSGTGQVVFASPNASFATGYAGGSQITLTIGSGITIHGGVGAGAFDIIRAFSPDKIVNQGTISADVVGQTITANAINGPVIVNQGTMSATAGTLHLYNLQNSVGATLSASGAGTVWLDGPSWTNAGTISSSNGTVDLGGTFTLAALGMLNRSGGTVNLSGTLNNAGGTLALTAATGTWNVPNGGKIVGGTVTASGGVALAITGEAGLDGVTLDTDITVPSTFLDVRDGLTLNATLTLVEDAAMNVIGTQTISGTGQVLLGGHGNGDILTLLSVSGPPTLTIGPSITIQGMPGAPLTHQIRGAGTLINQGTISTVAAQTTDIFVTNLINQGNILSAATGARVNVTAKSVSLAAGSKLDIGIGSITVDYTGAADPMATLRSYLSSGVLLSSDSDATDAIGYADSTDQVVQGLAANSVLLKFTVIGDANLDGQVGFSDLLALAQNYGKSNANWDQGDFTGEGVVSFADLLILAQNYGRNSTRVRPARGA